MQGNVRDLSLAELLQFISLGRRTGQLDLKYGAECYSLRFRNGVIGSADAAVASSLRMLVASGMISPVRLEAALAECSLEGRDLGPVLIQQGQVTPADWDRFMQRELERLVYSLFVLPDATFDFRMLESAPNSVIKLNLPVDRVVLHGTGWAESWKAIQPPIPSVQSSYAPTVPHRLLMDEATSENEVRLAKVFLRQADVHTLAVSSGMSLLETAQSLACMVRDQRARMVSPS